MIPFWPNMSLQSVNRVSKGPSRFAIAGERLAVATTARTAVPRIKVFISHLTGIDAKTSPSRSDMALPSVGREALDAPALQYWNWSRLAEMLVGYDRDVSAASQTGLRGV